jgi:hypothetical protein
VQPGAAAAPKAEKNGTCNAGIERSRARLRQISDTREFAELYAVLRALLLPDGFKGWLAMTDYAVPPISQRTPKLCWEACGRMLSDWRYRDDAGTRARYAQTAGRYARLDTGLVSAQMDKFYRRLGIQGDLMYENVHAWWRESIAWAAFRGVWDAQVQPGV